MKVIQGNIYPHIAIHDWNDVTADLLPFASEDSAWDVTSTGDDYKDRITGIAYAIEAIQYMIMKDYPQLLSDIMVFMSKKKPWGNIEYFFLATIAKHSIKGAVQSNVDFLSTDLRFWVPHQPNPL